MTPPPTPSNLSYWLIGLALALALTAAGVVTTIIVSAVGVVLVFVAIVGWTWENRGASEADHEQR